MSWFINFKKPKIKSNVESSVPHNLWKTCKLCHEMIFLETWEKDLYVCPNCNFHERIDAFKRLEILSDKPFELIDIPATKDDPINFKCLETYKNKLKKNRSKNQSKEAAIAAKITINKNDIIAFSMDFNFIGGSMGSYVGNCFVKAAQTAVKEKLPFIAITSSGGARMQEGIISLMQMPKTILACNMLKEHKIPYIVIFTDPTTGGVLASFASLADITLAEPNALIGFTGPRVIEETMQIKLTKDFQKSEFHLKYGFIDDIVERKNLKNEISKIINILYKKGNKENE